MRLELVGSNITLDLNALMTNVNGVQALSGATGFGMPGVETFWQEGAGDGATYLSRRVLPRDVDLPLYIRGSNRENFRNRVELLQKVLGGPMTLRWIADDGKVYTLQCYRVGGGSYSYGSTDHNGGNELTMVVTLRAGQPYWEQNPAQSKTLTTGDVDIANNGTATSPPRWELTGPLTEFKATSQLGRVLHWKGNLASGQKRIIDASDCSVTSPDGTNFYSELEPAPKFWHLAPGNSTINISKSGTGTAKVTWNPRMWMVV